MADKYVVDLPEEPVSTVAKTGKEGARSKAASNMIKQAGIGVMAPTAGLGIELAPAVELLASIGARALPYLAPIFMSGDTEEYDESIASIEGIKNKNRFTGNEPPTPPKIPYDVIGPAAAVVAQQTTQRQPQVQRVVEQVAQRVEPIVEAVTPRVRLVEEVVGNTLNSPVMQRLDQERLRALEATKRVLDYQLTNGSKEYIKRATDSALKTLQEYGYRVDGKHAYDAQRLLQQAIDNLKRR